MISSKKNSKNKLKMFEPTFLRAGLKLLCLRHTLQILEFKSLIYRWGVFGTPLLETRLEITSKIFF